MVLSGRRRSAELLSSRRQSLHNATGERFRQRDCRQQKQNRKHHGFHDSDATGQASQHCRGCICVFAVLWLSVKAELSSRFTESGSQRFDGTPVVISRLRGRLFANGLRVCVARDSGRPTRCIGQRRDPRNKVEPPAVLLPLAIEGHNAVAFARNGSSARPLAATVTTSLCGYTRPEFLWAPGCTSDALPLFMVSTHR